MTFRILCKLCSEECHDKVQLLNRSKLNIGHIYGIALTDVIVLVVLDIPYDPISDIADLIGVILKLTQSYYTLRLRTSDKAKSRRSLLPCAQNLSTFYSKMFVEDLVSLESPSSEERDEIVRALGGAVSRNEVDVVELILETGHVKVSDLDRPEWYTLERVCWRGQTELARLLLKHGADANVRNVEGFTPLLSASMNGHVEVMRVLLQHDVVDVNVTDDHGWTVLHHCASVGDAEAVGLLIENGADCSIKDMAGETPQRRASWHGHYKAERLLLEHENTDACTGPLDEFFFGQMTWRWGNWLVSHKDQMDACNAKEGESHRLDAELPNGQSDTTPRPDSKHHDDISNGSHSSLLSGEESSSPSSEDCDEDPASECHALNIGARVVGLKGGSETDECSWSSSQTDQSQESGHHEEGLGLDGESTPRTKPGSTVAAQDLPTTPEKIFQTEQESSEGSNTASLQPRENSVQDMTLEGIYWQRAERLLLEAKQASLQHEATVCIWI